MDHANVSKILKIGLKAFVKWVTISINRFTKTVYLIYSKKGLGEIDMKKVTMADVAKKLVFRKAQSLNI